MVIFKITKKVTVKERIESSLSVNYSLLLSQFSICVNFVQFINASINYFSLQAKKIRQKANQSVPPTPLVHFWGLLMQWDQTLPLSLLAMNSEMKTIRIVSTALLSYFESCHSWLFLSITKSNL